MSNAPIQTRRTGSDPLKTPVNSSAASLYGRDYQLRQAQKYRDREKNHWKTRIGLAHELVDRFALPRLGDRSPGEITVADIGCSIGTFAIEFAKRGFQSFGVDYDAAALTIARELAAEEGVSPTFIEGDHRSVSAVVGGSGEIDIAVCFDLFEHLFDDQLGALFCSLRESLARDGALIFHSFPTELDYVFLEDQCRGTPTLAHFAELKPEAFERLARAYASMFDAYLLMTTGRTHRQKRESWQHCNPLTARRLRAMLERGGFEVVFIETKQLYEHSLDILDDFAQQPVSYQNLYGVAVPV